jgi:O-antigen/teichoic acid export membrane protein
MVTRPLVLLAGALLLTIQGWNSPRDAISVQLAAYTTSMLVVIILFMRKRPAHMRAAKPIFDRRAWLVAAVPFTFLAVTLAANNQIQVVLLGVLSTQDQVGYFSTASSVAYFASLPLMVMNLVVAPHFARLHSNGGVQSLQQLTTKVARYSLAATVPIALVFFAIGDYLVEFVFGAEFDATYTPALILVVGQIANVVAGPCGQILNMTGNERFTVFGVGAGLIVNVALGVLLVPDYGAVGATISSCAGVIVWNAYMVLFAHQKIGIDTTIFGMRRRILQDGAKR